jgi:hypothetical protein
MISRPTRTAESPRIPDRGLLAFLTLVARWLGIRRRGCRRDCPEFRGFRGQLHPGRRMLAFGPRRGLAIDGPLPSGLLAASPTPRLNVKENPCHGARPAGRAPRHRGG